MYKKRRTRAEVSERHLVRPAAQKKDQHNGTLPTEKVATTRGLLKTFWAAVQLLIAFILVFLLFIRLMSWLSVFEWSKSRCQLLSPSSLKMADLKSLLEERGFNASQHSREDLETAVWQTGGVMEIEMEAFLEADNSTGKSQWNALRFETWKAFDDNIPKQTIGVYLVLCSSELEQRSSELKRWRQFLHRLSKNGVKFVFVGCDNYGDCATPKVTLITIRTSNGYKNWSYFSYAGPIRPSDIFQWITKTLSANVVWAKNVTDVANHRDRLTHSIVTHSTRPLPLSYAVLASELRGRVSFFWVKTLDEYLPNRASLMILGEASYLTYHRNHFLDQWEIRWLVRLMTIDADEMYQLIIWFLFAVALTIPFMAGGSMWQKVKAMLWFLLLCVLAIFLFTAWAVRYHKDIIEAMQYPAAMFRSLIMPFRPDLLLIFHLFSEYPLMQLVLPVYALMAAFDTRLSKFFNEDIHTFFRCLFMASENSVSPDPTVVTTVSATTPTQMLLKIAQVMLKIPFNITKATINVLLATAKTIAKIIFIIVKATINVPLATAKTIAKIIFIIVKTAINVLLAAVKTIAKIFSSIAKTNSQLPQDVAKTTPKKPSDVTIATGGADGRAGYETVDLSAPSQRLRAVCQSQSIQSQSSSPMADPHQQDYATFTSPSEGTTRASNRIQPFEYPSLDDSADGDLDKTTAEQMARLKIPKIWLQPIISEKELKLLVALQKSEARDLRSFEPGSETVPRCFYCGVYFQPTSEVRVLPCCDIFHPKCMDKWMKAGNIDCPICQIPLYAKDRRNLA